MPAGNTERRAASAPPRSRRSEGSSFSLLIRLPDDSLCHLKHINDGCTVQQVKEKLELRSGFCGSTYRLIHVDGKVLDDDSILRLGETILTDNTILKLTPNKLFVEIYTILSNGDNSIMQAMDLYHDDITQDDLFHTLFMASYHGNKMDCQCLIDNGEFCSRVVGDVTTTQSTANGNTPLHAAVAKDKVSTGLFLCERGADIYQKNRQGNTPLDVGLEFGSFTAERQLRLSQWGRRKAKMEKTSETEITDRYNMPHDYVTNLTHQTHDIPTRLAYQSQSRHSSGSSKTQPSRCKSAVNRPSTGLTSDSGKRARVQSAPPLNSEARNKRLCAEMKAMTAEEKKELMKKKAFKLSRPQYLQFIKSSTGIVEEDYFADIFPEQEVDKRPTVRSFDDQMKRNERIFRKMCKESGVAHQDSDTDSDEEMVRKYANKKAVQRWTKKKQLQKQQEQDKKRITPSYPTDDSRKQCLGELLMIGDTSRGAMTENDPASYMKAYQSYKHEGRSKSAVSTGSKVGVSDPMTYEEWCDMKPEANPPTTTKDKTIIRKQELKKRIEYEAWLQAANKRIQKQISEQRREEKQKRDFDNWIRDLKEEVGTFDYWKRRKQEQEEKEKKIAEMRRREEARKVVEKSKRKELAQEIYRHWVVDKEMRKIEQEEKRLQLENKKLQQMKQKQSSR